ncbi:exonuclease SbcC [Terribacillus halophilus]|uniref:Nuclease SbcCD subunit C n=1 Tax=Terribacillus halophilus TaxID=361279 RepID=A0A1G6VBF9_9BACI|nr:AAA family ATPase [Terribacillus halophilus]SDD50784.1 exonuclease SbcC [Terribacillus halophilus]
MRAITLQMTAFGPYHKAQTIDFRELGAESIFLITGPTGAGKTTIFDAICYSLYGRASGSDRDQDSLRSHFAEPGETTEVRYRFALRGTEYEIIRYPKQQKKKERGEGFTDDPARAEFYEWKDGEKVLISSRVKEVNEAIEEKIGLDYEQFRKMIMIPQGEFRKLISENSKEREEILQRIFRTYFYERMTEALKDEAKQLKEKLQQTEWKEQQQISKIEWRTQAPAESDSVPETMQKLQLELEAITASIKEGEQELVKHKKNWQERQQQYYEAKQLLDTFKQLEQALVQKEQLEQKSPAIEQKKQQLVNMEQASRLLPYERQLAARKQEWQRQTKALQETKERKDLIEKQYITIKSSYTKAKEQEPKRLKRQEQLQLEKQQLEQWKEYEKRKLELVRIQKTLEDKQQRLLKLHDAHADKKTKQSKLEQDLSGEAALIQAFFEEQGTYEKLERQLEEAVRLKESFLQLQEMRTVYQQTKQLLLDKENDVRRLREEIAKMEEAQAAHHAAHLAGQLAEGEPCPVCGSSVHPSPAKITAHIQSFELLKQKRMMLDEAQRAYDEVQKRYVEAKSNGQAIRQVTDELYRNITGETSFDHTELEQLKTRIQTERDKTAASLRTKQAERKQFEQKKQMLDQLKQTLVQEEKAAEELQVELRKLEETYHRAEAEVSYQRKQLPEVLQDHAEWEQKIKQEEAAIEAAFRKWEELQHQYEEISRSKEQIAAALESTDKFTADLEQSYQQEEQTFLAKLGEAGFANTEAYRLAKGTEQEIKILQKEVDWYAQQRISVAEQIETLRKQTDQREKPELVVFEQAVTEAEQLVEAKNSSLNAAKSYASHHENIMASLSQLQEEAADQKAQYYDIGELANLAKGDNGLRLSFERYVLTSFLDEIILQANIRLEEMTDHRYQLKRSGQIAKRGAQSGLDLEVVDHHTGQERPVKTLSGGEGFKAALSLALGMSDVVQAHAGGVELETLFIDEGFGTLDEVSLEQAIDSLKGLQASNRVLGIISHVPQLKEEIHTKLQIDTSPKGSSAKFIFQ